MVRQNYRAPLALEVQNLVNNGIYNSHSQCPVRTEPQDSPYRNVVRRSYLDVVNGLSGSSVMNTITVMYHTAKTGLARSTGFPSKLLHEVVPVVRYRIICIALLLTTSVWSQ